MDINSPARTLAIVALFSSFANADEPGPPVTTPTPPTLGMPSDRVDTFDGQRSSFRDAIDAALRQNPQVVVATQEVKRAYALLEQVRSSSLPTLTANGSYTHLDGDRVVNNTIALAQDEVAANLTAAMPLVSAKTWTQWAHARDNVRVADYSTRDVRRSLAIATGRAYLTVLTQRRLVEVSRIARDAAIAFHDFAKARLDGGVGNRIDEVRAAQEVATDESQLATATTQLRRAREALGVLMGVEGPVEAAEEPQLAEQTTVEEALGGINARADVNLQQQRRVAAHKVTRDSYTDYIPILTGSIDPFYQNPPTLTVPKTGWQAQLVLVVPLYDGGLRYGQRKERTALEKEANVQLDGALRQARSEVRVAFDAVRESDRAMQEARDAAKLAKEALQLANIAYRAGASTNFELIDAERQARDADTQSALAEDAARQARLDLLSASGRFPDSR